MSGKQSNTDFRLMSFAYRFRDLFSPRSAILKESGLSSGDHVLDYGCGPGSYVEGVLKIMGETGKLYALDIHPAAVERIGKMAKKKNWKNVKAILSNRDTGLADNCLDVVLLYDVFHKLYDPEGVLGEIHRVLKKDGKLSFSDHHMKDGEILNYGAIKRFFKVSKKGKKTFLFDRK